MPGSTLTRLTEAVQPGNAVSTEGSDRLLITLITPGVGSSGYYAPEVLEAAATDKVWPAGTHCYVNHPSESERYDRPERDIDDLAAVLTEDARWDGERLVAEARLFPHKRYLADMSEAVGMSIRAAAEVVEGEHDGKRMPIVQKLTEGVSVDFVTKAGRGGYFELVESAPRPSVVNESAIRRGVAEATVNELRERLQQVLRETYGGEDSWVWVRDFDDSTVWFEHETPDESGVWQQAYTTSEDGAVALSGDRVEVRAETRYVPVDPAGDASTTTQESEEDTMPDNESQRALEEANGRVTALEAERDTARQERDAARRALAEANARTAATTRARTRVTEANADLAPVTVDRIVAAATATVPLTEAGELDEAALDRQVDAARTAEETYLAGLAEASGAGTVRGLGGGTTTTSGDVSEADVDTALAGAFGTQTVKGA